MFVCIPPGQAVPEMIYRPTVLGGTLNPTHSPTHVALKFITLSSVTQYNAKRKRFKLCLFVDGICTIRKTAR